METDLHDYGGRDIPQPAVCKLENQKGQWSNSVPVQRSKNQELQYPGGQEEMGIPAQEERENSSSFSLFYLDAPLVKWCPPMLVRVDVLYSTY